jgi:uncharacterized membrane protein YtjA (UPF0391 family)
LQRPASRAWHYSTEHGTEKRLRKPSNRSSVWEVYPAITKGRRRTLGIAEYKQPGTGRERRFTMLGWALTFLLVAFIAAILGFGGIAGTAAGIAKILFFFFIIIFLVSLVAGLARRA